MTDRPWDVVVVGAGILGLATARELLRRNPDARVLVLEREPEIASHQTGHNSGVIHAGIYYAPGSLKAQLCTAGREALYEYCDEHAIPYERCGKLIIALDDTELRKLDELERRGRENGVPGLAPRRRPASARSSPTPSGVAALHSPETGIIDFAAVARTMAAEIQAAGAEIHTGVAVHRLSRNGRATIVETSHGPDPDHQGRRLRRPLVRPPRRGLRRVRRPPDHPVPRRLPEAQARSPIPREVPDLPGPGPVAPVPRRPPHQDDLRRHLARPDRAARPLPSGLLAAHLRPPRPRLHPDLARHLAHGPPLLAHGHHRDRLRRPPAEPSSRPAPPTSRPSSPPTSNPARPASEPKP